MPENVENNVEIYIVYVGLGLHYSLLVVYLGRKGVHQLMFFQTPC